MPGQRLEFGAGAWFPVAKTVLDPSSLGHTHRQHFETRYGLQRRIVLGTDEITIDRRLVALVKERQHGHPLHLWKRVVDDIAIASFRKQRAAADRKNDQRDSKKSN